MPKKKEKKEKNELIIQPRKVGGIWVDPTCYPFFDYEGETKKTPKDGDIKK